MNFKLISDSFNEGVRESSYLFPVNLSIDNDSYSKEYDKELINCILGDEVPCYLFYVEKFPSLITKVRSHKGLLESDRNANFEKKITAKESYLGFLLKLNQANKVTVFDYFFTPNNCCLIKTSGDDSIDKLKENVFHFNFYDSQDSFWIDYNKLSRGNISY